MYCSALKFLSLPWWLIVFVFNRTGFFGTLVEYGAERKISRHSVVAATVSIGVPQGVSLKIRLGLTWAYPQ